MVGRSDVPRTWNPIKVADDGTVRKISELRPDLQEDAFKEPHGFKSSPGLCWHVVFAPDESYFAWICSPRKVILVPWNREKNCLEGEISASTSGSVNSEEKRRPRVVIECGYPVVAVAFGCGARKPLQEQNKNHWTRFDFSKDTILATGHTNGRIRLWNAETGRLQLELMDHKSDVRDLSFSPDGSLRLVSASIDGTLKGWDLNEDGNMFKTFYAHGEPALWCTWSPDSKFLASAGAEKTVYVWDMTEYFLLRKLDGHSHNVVSCSYSPDGAVLATASWDSQVILWDPHTGQKLRSLYHLHPPPNMIYAAGANSAWVRGVCFAKNGMGVVTISDDHLVRFWNLMGDVDPEAIAGDAEKALCCAYSPSGRTVAVGTRQFNVYFYSAPMEVPNLMHLARMAIRKVAHATKSIDDLELPVSLKSYLKYEVWN